MCTAVIRRARGCCFGRNLDVPASYGEEVLITPRNAPLPFRLLPSLERHHALIGAGLAEEGYPLYFEALNEHGLWLAGLNFPGNAVYRQPVPDRDNAAPWELIPWLLGQCASLAEARPFLERLNLTALPFSGRYPLAPLHWMLADREGAVVIEPAAEGLRIYENPVGVLTNNPPFPYHLEHLSHFLHLTREAPENRFAPQIPLSPCSLGVGACGLPGDWSSASRFLRAAFAALNAVSGDREEEQVTQIFHILDTAAQPRGCARAGEGWEHTVYASCCSAETGRYYYATYENRQITCVDLRQEDLEGSRLVRCPMTHTPRIAFQTGEAAENRRNSRNPP